MPKYSFFFRQVRVFSPGLMSKSSTSQLKLFLEKNHARQKQNSVSNKASVSSSQIISVSSSQNDARLTHNFAELQICPQSALPSPLSSLCLRRRNSGKERQRRSNESVALRRTLLETPETASPESIEEGECDYRP